MGEFGALMYKNWILYKRGLCGNIIELLIPSLFCLFIIFITQISPPQLIPEQSFFTNTKYSKVFDSTTVSSLMDKCPSKSVIALAPSSSDIATKFSDLLKASSFSTSLYANQGEIQAYIRSPSYSTSLQICWAVIIESESNNYQYKLRFNTSSIGLNNVGPQTSPPPLTSDLVIDLKSYETALQSGKIGVNYFINNLIFQKELGSSNRLRQFTSPVYQQQVLKDTIYQNLYRWVDLIYLLPLLIVYVRQTFLMLSEKQAKVRENMRAMGMNMKTYYLTWFIRYFIVYCIIHGMATGLIAFKLTFVPFYIPLVLFILFDILIIIQNLFIQVFFSRARFGITIALLFFIVQYSACYVVSNTNPGERFKTFLSFIPHVAFVFAFQNILYFQSQKITASFNQSINSFTIRTALFSFAGNILVFLILLWYFDQIIPSQWGQRRNPFFCCCSKDIAQRRKKEDENSISQSIGSDVKIQSYQQKAQPRDIANIQNIFDQQNKRNKENFDLTLKKNEIFVLLGNPGAGKTSIISKLTGIIQPATGWATIFGQDDIDKIKQEIGFCPQENTLYQELTVQEHLSLFAYFKGQENRQNKIQRIVIDLKLNDCKQKFVKELNQSQKRKLSIAISLIGRSKFILLDEPTIKMDSNTRKDIWDILQAYKKDRIIILTTNETDQADYLGDKVGIMSQGKLLCCQSINNLKETYGLGYKVTFVKKDYSTESSQKIIEIIRKDIANAVVLSDVAFQLSIQLPLRQAKYFEGMFDTIDNKKEELGIASYGIKMANLEEVMLKVDKRYQSQLQKRQPNNEGSTVERRIERQKGNCIRFLNHFRATFIKRLRVFKRGCKNIILQFLLPLGIIVGTVFFIRVSYINDSPPQSINLNTYISQQNPVVIPIGSADNSLLSSMKDSLNSQYGFQINIKADTTNILPENFDQKFLLPLKIGQRTLKGGIFFLPSSTSGSVKEYPFRSICITRSPTSYFFLPGLATQALINSQLGAKKQITVIDHPLPLTFDQLSLGTVISGFLGAFLFSIAMAFKYASVITFLVKQKEDKAKDLQIHNGMKITSYWFANFIYDYLLYLLLAVPAVILCYFLNVPFLSQGSTIQATILLFAIYGLAYIPLTYIFTFLFSRNGTAQSVYFFLTIFVGGLLPGLTFALRFLSSQYNFIGRLLGWILRIHPAFAFGQAIINLSSVNVYKPFENDNIAIDPLTLQISLAPICYLSAQFILYFILLFAVQNCSRKGSCCTKKPSLPSTQAIKESDVRKQEEANNKNSKGKKVHALGLTKVYKNGNDQIVAVSNLSLAIQKGQICGVLGASGAGKSTVFKLLSGQIQKTSGQSYICNQRVQMYSEKIQQKIGYCHQYDAFVDSLTVRQQIQLFYDLKSLRSEQKESIVSQTINDLGLKEYENEVSETLSAGNKRKLSIALAILGNPKVIFLDEPSKGMDPVSKRFVWKKISKISRKSAILIITNSLDEGEALSKLLAIMDKGRLKSIGSPKEIKMKYGDGIEVQIKMKSHYENTYEKIKSKGFEQKSTVQKGDLKNTLDRLQAGSFEINSISNKGCGMYINEMLEKDNRISLLLLVQYLQACFIYRKIFTEILAEFGEIELLDAKHNHLKFTILQKPKISNLFAYFQDKKQMYGIYQYNFKQISLQEIFKKIIKKEQ